MNPAANPVCSTNRALKPSKMPGMTSRSGDWIKVRSVAVCDIGTHSLQREDGHAETLLMIPGAVRARHTRSRGSDGRAVSRSVEQSDNGGYGYEKSAERLVCCRGVRHRSTR